MVLNETYSVYRNSSKDIYTDTLTDNIMAKQQITWLIRRGDLLLSDVKKETKKEFMFRFQESEDRKFRLPIYEYPNDDDDVPDRFEVGQTGM